MRISVLGIFCFLFMALAGAQEGSNKNMRAKAVLYPTSHGKVKGEVRFMRRENGLRVQGEIRGLKPGPHGMHIHEYGDCSDSGAVSAGDHFNPDHRAHGAREVMERHAGDLGNITADKSGIARIDFMDSLITLEGDRSIIGRALVVHEKADDLKSQPAGNSGKRLACGVIGIQR